MFLTVHALSSGVIAQHVANPVLLAPLCFIQHLMLDSVPHYDFGTHWDKRPKYMTALYSILDLTTAFTLTYFLYAQKVGLFLWFISFVFAVLPDFLEIPWHLFYAKKNDSKPGVTASTSERIWYGIVNIQNRFHTRFADPVWGCVTQIASLSVFLSLA